MNHSPHLLIVFYRHRHHLAAISSAIQRADAQTILRLATDLALSTVT